MTPSHRLYSSNAVHSASDLFINTKEGRELGDKVWQEIVDELKTRSPEVERILQANA